MHTQRDLLGLNGWRIVSRATRYCTLQHLRTLSPPFLARPSSSISSLASTTVMSAGGRSSSNPPDGSAICFCRLVHLSRIRKATSPELQPIAAYQPREKKQIKNRRIAAVLGLAALFPHLFPPRRPHAGFRDTVPASGQSCPSIADVIPHS